MVVLSGASRRVVIPFILAAGLAGTTGPSAVGATPPCRVRNLTQDTSGRSLARMVERAENNDRLRVRGLCGPVSIGKDLVIVGVGDRAVLRRREGVGPVVIIGTDADVTLRGLTLRGGDGGIFIYGRLRLVDSDVRDNDRERFFSAGAVHVQGPDEARLRMIRSRVRGNDGMGITADAGVGGVSLVDSVVARNRGGGIGGFDFSLSLTDSVVRENHSRRGGGGLDLGAGAGATLARSRVVANRARFGGGGISVADASLRLVESVVRGNRAWRGGGILGRGDSVLLEGTLVAANTAGTKGGGIFSSGPLTLTDSQVRRNSAASGGGIFNRSGTVTLDASSSVTGNTPDDCVGTPAC